MFYLKLYDRNGKTEQHNCRNLAYAKREADLLRTETETRNRLKKIEICSRSNENETQEQIVEAFYFE